MDSCSRLVMESNTNLRPEQFLVEVGEMDAQHFGVKIRVMWLHGRKVTGQLCISRTEGSPNHLAFPNISGGNIPLIIKNLPRYSFASFKSQ